MQTKVEIIMSYKNDIKSVLVENGNTRVVR